ncbi:hypothetical protein [Desulforamulus aquiferis]|uniref:Uncharacterized protein n=1 Tax=Desulforamulus aquiferis TaxID=1397668 RepID=A0AAW7ZDA7_9FIRM|nr:hypothetical protein [Desulforamulus aquiferis]MDO7787240.1 hypothetical protein [Desulforamulus aquiferis]
MAITRVALTPDDWLKNFEGMDLIHRNNGSFCTGIYTQGKLKDYKFNLMTKLSWIVKSVRLSNVYF